MKSTEPRELLVGQLRVALVRKDIKNIHLTVHPPAGDVRISVPLSVKDEAVRLAVIKKLSWIRRQQSRFASQDRQSKREMVNGESHFYLGRRYRLRLMEGSGAQGAALRGVAILELRVRHGSDREHRESILNCWYRKTLRAFVSPLVERWERRLRVKSSNIAIRKMRTRWGTCIIESGRITLNTELAKKPPECIEFIVVHELCHLLERSHGPRFVALMDKYLPDWRSRKALLNTAPLARDDWEC